MISIFNYRWYECYVTLCYMYLQVIRINIIIIINTECVTRCVILQIMCAFKVCLMMRLTEDVVKNYSLLKDYAILVWIYQELSV